MAHAVIPPRYAEVRVGDRLPTLAKPAIDRVQLALYAGASGDHNAIHLDDDRAKAVDLPGVIAQGMLSMAFLGQLVTDWTPLWTVRGLGGRFVAMVVPGAVLTCTGTIAGKSVTAGENRVEIDIAATDATGQTVVVGKAVVALP